MALSPSFSDCMFHASAEGSGFISLDLARRLPRRVTQGRVITPPFPSTDTPAHSHTDIDTDTDTDRTTHATHSPHQLLPYAYQVRVFSTQHGVFKGTLVVDCSLPADTLVLRPSMRKVAAPVVVKEYEQQKLGQQMDGTGTQKDDVVSVEVVNTATNNVANTCPLPQSSLLYEEVTSVYVKSDNKSVCSNGKLNRFLILLLHANGVSERIFQDLARYQCASLKVRYENSTLTL